MTAVADQPVGGRVTVRPAPRREPPFDDERSTANLRLVSRHDQPLPFEQALPVEPWGGRLAEPTPWAAAQPTRRRELPEPQAFARRLLVAIFEVRAGRRPVAQLASQLAPAVLNGLSADMERRAQRGGGAARTPATVRSVHVGEPADGVAEIAAVVQAGARCRAVAARLEGLDGRWRCVRLQIG